MSGELGYQEMCYLLHCRTKELFEVSTNAAYSPIIEAGQATAVSDSYRKPFTQCGDPLPNLIECPFEDPLPTTKTILVNFQKV